VLAAVILAAGESKRMGSPKALLPYRGQTFLDHLAEVTRDPRVGWMRVVVGSHADLIRGMTRVDASAFVVNPDWQKGQLSSIQAAIRSLPEEKTDGILLCLVDHPLISAETVKTLIDRFYSSGRFIVLPTYKGKRGHPVIFSAALYDELLAAPLEVGARAVVWTHANEILEIPTEDDGVVLNLNDPETLRRALTSNA
jgi:molybdenum cofactor cytidylyltransferase